jgi:hypothetical protein
MHGCLRFRSAEDGGVIASKQTLALPDTSAAWPKIAKLANTFDEPGYKIPVWDETGGIVILIGAATLAAPAMQSHLASFSICSWACQAPF